MTGIITAIIVFGVIIAIHEAGHFITAKMCGIRVNKFAIGMGPAVFKWGKGETEYSIRLLPIGGFCAMEGEDEQSSDSRAFRNKSVYKRMAVVAAGAFMNVLLGFILIIITSSLAEAIPSLTIDSFHYKEDAEGDKINTASSSDSGLREGDSIISVNGSHILTTTDLSYEVYNTAGKKCSVEVKRNGKNIVLDNVEFYDSETKGIFDFYVTPLDVNFINVMKYSALDTAATVKLVWSSLTDLITGKYGINDMSGPVGIVNEIGNAAKEGETVSDRIQSVISLTTFITINLGVFNLLPIPALDGGRLLFLIIEAIRRKPIPEKYEAAVHAAGMALLMGVIVVVTINDVYNLL